MPILATSSYGGPPNFMFNGHLETIVPNYIRHKIELTYERERITLSDGDFLDLDWIKKGSNNLVILTHGIIGNSSRYYILRGADYFSSQGWDVLAWNCRSRGGEMNKKLRLYHHGEVEDITELVAYVDQLGLYDNIYLVGYSMGGAMIVKYFHVKSAIIPSSVAKGVSICAPFDLEYCCLQLERPHNFFYQTYFLNELKGVFKAKAAQFPDQLDMSLWSKSRKWRHIDTHFSAPVNGFASADEFYYHASIKNFLTDVKIPTLVICAQNDPIIPFEVVPKDVFSAHSFLYLEVPERGGHVGFTTKKRGDKYAWIDYRSWEFFND